ncbi:hypothetical protein [Jeotgalibacillus marinus]|uniref:Phosphatase n=1 Tax=Jeotgalibacillus marinus TaxID=86667 RepID=A0ABV3Q7Q0_9BACL
MKRFFLILAFSLAISATDATLVNQNIQAVGPPSADEPQGGQIR